MKEIDFTPMCRSCIYFVINIQLCKQNPENIVSWFKSGLCPQATPYQDPNGYLVRAINPTNGKWMWQEGKEDGPRGVRYFSDDQIYPTASKSDSVSNN